jgi:4-oxalocrotonate tautomerase
MPHVIVKLWPGRPEEIKKGLADEITKDVVNAIGCEDWAVSVAFEEVPKDEWAEKVYKPDILDNEKNIYKKPGYNPFK